MSGELRGFARDGSIYALAQILGKASGLVLLPLYAYQLSVDEYALYTVLIAVSDLCALLLGLGINAALARLYFEKPDESSHQRQVVGTVFTAYLLFAVVAAFASWAASPLISKLIFGQQANPHLFALTIVAVLLIVVFEMTSGYYVVRKRPRAVLALAAGKLVALLSLNILFVVVLDMAVLGIVLALAAAFASVALPSAALILRGVGFHLRLSIVKSVLSLGLPMVPSAAANGTIKVVERQLLIAQSTLAAAVFGIADRLMSLINQFLAAPFSKVFLVRRFETLSKSEDQDELARVFLLFVALLGVAGLGTVAFSPEILAVVAPAEFAPAIKVMPWLAVAYACASLTVNMEIGLLYAKRSWLIPIIGTAALALSIALNLVLIPRFGPVGAAAAAVIVGVLRLAATITVNARMGSPLVTAPWARISLLLGITFLLGVLAVETPLGSQEWLARVGRLMILCGFVALTISGPLLDRATKEDVKHLLSRLPLLGRKRRAL